MIDQHATHRAVKLLRDKLGKEDFPIDAVVNELLADYDAKCQALAAKEKQEQEFHSFMEALAVKLKKANALTMAGALEEVVRAMKLLQEGHTLIKTIRYQFPDHEPYEIETWLLDAAEANIK